LLEGYAECVDRLFLDLTATSIVWLAPGTGVVQPNAYRQVVVTPPVGGRVTKVGRGLATAFVSRILEGGTDAFRKRERRYALIG
jgi:hypothetical protein